tara:strand:- start:29 stop:445 length:417 start_codon:yes stop_codon:yes gene_type:complete
MPYKDPEQSKLYYELNKEKIKQRVKKYNEENKQKISEYQKDYRKENKEQLKVYHKEKKKDFNTSEDGKKVNKIKRWKLRGVINDDFSSLYDYYLNCKNCEECNVEFYSNGNNRRCLDHDHETGLFRNVLCSLCNVRRR